MTHGIERVLTTIRKSFLESPRGRVPVSQNFWDRERERYRHFYAWKISQVGEEEWRTEVGGKKGGGLKECAYLYSKDNTYVLHRGVFFFYI